MGHFLIRLGLLVAALAVAGLIFVDTEMAEGHEAVPREMLLVGAAIFAGGVGINLLSRFAGLAHWARRCPKCGHSVKRGHVYCTDHFQEAVDQARDYQRHR